MKTRIISISIVVLTLALGVVIGRSQAQSASPFTMVGNQPHTSCPAPTPGQAQFCVANDGLWQSLNGGVYAQLGTLSGPVVTSFNGQSGAVTFTPPAPPVTSVNGKTGAVVLGASTTIQ